MFLSLCDFAFGVCSSVIIATSMDFVIKATLQRLHSPCAALGQSLAQAEAGMPVFCFYVHELQLSHFL